MSAVEVRGWDPFGGAVAAFAGFPALLVQPMMAPAGKRQLVDVGAPAVGPGGDVVDFGEVAGHGAARVQIRTVNGGDLDLSNSSARMLARILGSVARAESEHKGERQKRANVQKAAIGKWQTANRAFGYTMTGEPLEPEATAISTAVTDVLAGKSINQVAREWNAKGLKGTLGRPWNAPSGRRTLINPRYTALKVHRGKVVGPSD
jgi:Recombinase/Resolvase, N terminal domain